jgi:hypothetical protein
LLQALLTHQFDLALFAASLPSVKGKTLELVAAYRADYGFGWHWVEPVRVPIS